MCLFYFSIHRRCVNINKSLKKRDGLNLHWNKILKEKKEGEINACVCKHSLVLYSC